MYLHQINKYTDQNYSFSQSWKDHDHDLYMCQTRQQITIVCHIHHTVPKASSPFIIIFTLIKHKNADIGCYCMYVKFITVYHTRNQVDLLLPYPSDHEVLKVHDLVTSSADQSYITLWMIILCIPFNSLFNALNCIYKPSCFICTFYWIKFCLHQSYITCCTHYIDWLKSLAIKSITFYNFLW